MRFFSEATVHHTYSKSYTMGRPTVLSMFVKRILTNILQINVNQLTLAAINTLHARIFAIKQIDMNTFRQRITNKIGNASDLPQFKRRHQEQEYIFNSLNTSYQGLQHKHTRSRIFRILTYIMVISFIAIIIIKAAPILSSSNTAPGRERRVVGGLDMEYRVRNENKSPPELRTVVEEAASLKDEVKTFFKITHKRTKTQSFVNNDTKVSPTVILVGTMKGVSIKICAFSWPIIIICYDTKKYKHCFLITSSICIKYLIVHY